MYILYFSFALFLSQIISLKVTLKSTIEKEFEKYVSELEFGGTHSDSTVFMNSLSCNCTIIIDQFLRKCLNSAKILDNGILMQNQTKQILRKPKFIFIFVPEVKQIFDALNKLLVSKIYKNRALIQFIICSQVSDGQLNSKILKHIWMEKLFNFIVVYVNQKLEVVSYNKFQKRKLLNFTNEKYTLKNLFPQKINNVNGYRFKVGILDDPLINHKVKGTWIGKDIENLKVFLRQVNGTAKIVTVISYENLTYDFKGLDFPMINIFPGPELLKKVDIIIPVIKDNLICVIPRVGLVSRIKYFFQMYHYMVIIVLLFALILVAAVSKLGESSEGFARFLFDSIQCSLGGSVVSLNRRSFSIKVAFLSILIFGALNSAILQTNLTSYLLTNKIDMNINTMEELLNSNFKIYAPHCHYSLLSANLQKKVTSVTSSEFLAKFKQGHLSGYIIQQNHLLTFLEVSSQFRVTFWKRFHWIKESVVPGYSMYIFPKNSPFVSEIDKHLVFFVAHTIRSPVHLKQIIPNEKIEIDHLASIFYILLVGHAAAALICLIEILWYNITIN